jgi:phosphoribosylformylglycinamidine synthase II
VTVRDDASITPELVREHGLSPEEYGRILAILGREPNLTELGIFSVMWSEHCSYKSSRIYLKGLPTTGDRVIQGPGENAGVIDIGDGLAAVFKMESHNHPSFIEPYQGAATGVGGILRDIFTMGARPIASLNSLRFGPLSLPKNRYLLSGVAAGIAGYGNCIGIPTVGGEINFHETYNGNPLVNVFNLGLAHRDRIFKGQASGLGNPVFYVGSKTGRDGIHGATMASEEFDETSEERRPTVQVGDPFCEKLLLEACLELFREDYLVGIQDMGAAGLTCSTCEMASRAGTGIEIDIARVPLRETGMTSYEVMLSESQERMLLVVEKGHEEDVRRIFSRWDLEAVEIGRVTGDGLMRVKDGGRLVAEIPAHALAEEGPVYERPKERPASLDEILSRPLPPAPPTTDFGKILDRLLGDPTIASKEWVWRQYDHMVRINTVTLPGAADAAVIRLPGTRRGIAMSVDGKSMLVVLDPFNGGAAAVAEAARNVVCTGARPVAITNCLNFGNPERPETMWQFAEAVRGMGEACRALGTPVTGGNVSFYNETLGQGIHPTPVIGMVGLLEDVEKRLGSAFRGPGEAVILLGPNATDALGGSEYLKTIHGMEGSRPPLLDLALEKKVQDLVLSLHAEGLLRSAHDVSDGGMAVTLAESCACSPDPVGAAVTFDSGETRPDAALFGESFSRIVVSALLGDFPRILAEASAAGVRASHLGFTGGDRLVIADPAGATLIDSSVAALGRVHLTGIERLLK